MSIKSLPFGFQLILVSTFAATVQTSISAIHSITGNVDIPAGTFAPDTYFGYTAVGNLTIQAGSIITGDPAWETPVKMTYSNFTIRNFATLHGEKYGVDFFSSASTLYNEPGGIISGDSNSGVRLFGDGTLYNKGTITSSAGNGVDYSYADLISNEGTITGALYGISGRGPMVIHNLAGGTITGQAESYAAIAAEAGSFILNRGSLVGGNGVVLTGSSSATTWVSNQNSIVASSRDGINARLVSGNLSISNSGILHATGNAIEGSIRGTNEVILGPGSDVIGNIRLYNDAIVSFLGGQLTQDAPVNRVVGDITGAYYVGSSGAGLSMIEGNVEADRVAIGSGSSLFVNGYLNGTYEQTGDVNVTGFAGGTGYWQAALTLGHNTASQFSGFSAGSTPIEMTTSPTQAIGAVEISEDFRMHGHSFITWDVKPDAPIAPGTNSDLIRSSTYAGNFQFSENSVVRISSTDPNQLISPGSYTFVESGFPILGAPGRLAVQLSMTAPDTGIQSTAWQQLVEANATQPVVVSLPFDDLVLTRYFAKSRVEGNEAIIDIDYNFAGLPGLNDLGSQIGAAFDRAADSGNPQTEDLISALALSDLSSVQQALQSISAPVESGLISFPAMILSTGRRLHNQIHDHLAETRGQSIVTVPMGQTIQPSHTPASLKGNAWAVLSADRQQAENQSGPDFDSDNFAFTTGVDYRVAPNLTVGALLDGAEANYDNQPDTESLIGALYGTWGEPTGFYADFIAGFGRHDLDITDAWSFQTTVTIGHTFRETNLRHGPFAGFEYQYLETDDFNAGLVDVETVKADSFRGIIGYRWETALGRFRPFAAIAYAHEFLDQNSHANASVLGQNFRTRGYDFGSALQVSLGTAFQLQENLSLHLGYRGEISTGGTDADRHGGSLGISCGF